jgi:hypothetical protein
MPSRVERRVPRSFRRGIDASASEKTIQERTPEGAQKSARNTRSVLLDGGRRRALARAAGRRRGAVMIVALLLGGAAIAVAMILDSVANI